MSDRDTLLQYKGNVCNVCGLSVRDMLDRYGTFERQFDFHHIDPTSKDKQYKRLMKQRLSRRQLDEIDKCVLLCKQCHGLLHAQDIRAQLTLSIDFRGRIVSQTVSGWVKADRVSKTMGFVTNQPYMLHPCRVHFGDGSELFLTVGEVSSRMLNWMRQMQSIQELRVFRLRDEKLVYSMKSLGDSAVAIQQLVQFPVLEIEYHQEESPREVVFLRNGYAMLRSGEIHSKGVVSYTLNLRDDFLQRADV